MDKENRLKSTLEGKISRIETFIESANEETDSVEIKVKLRTVIALQKNAEELRNNYYAVPNVKDAELTAIDEDLHLLEVRLESLENIKWKLKTIISNEDSSFAEPVDFLIVDKITEFTPSSSLDISNVEIPKFLTLADKSHYEANEVHALISTDIFFKVLKQNTYKVNEELFFKESEFGWIACGKLEERQTNKQGQCFLVNNDSIQDTLKLLFDLEGLGIRDDPVLHERDQALEIFKETVEFEKCRYIMQLPFRKSYNELSDNYPLAKQRFQNLWRIFGHDSELYQQYREIIRDYTEQGHKKDGRLTSKTRIVFDAGSHQNNELSLNDCLWPGINLNPNLLDILIKFRLNAIAFCSDIKQAFLQICLADEHKDAVRFLWSDDEPCVHKRPKLQVYRFNRVNFGVSSSPFLLAATIRHHIDKYKHEFPDTVELLEKNFYVDDLISSGNEFEEALQTSRRSKKYYGSCWNGPQKMDY
ncbi:integrase catalytic domain-containing protein [Trichonephila clavipes]|nr:integrase catalytic domain-containing protein [Trichonephila clavipes]